jgi:hypothetical protein
MSNTGRNKKLASFNCDEQLWSEFRQRCQEQGTTATTALTQLMQLYLEGKLDNLDIYSRDNIDERVKACVDEYLEKHLSSCVDKYLVTNYLATKTNAQASSTEEREFWSIQNRARHLRLKINANQRFKIEMFANDAYKERHGKLPSRQLYRGTQVYAYPAADLDILDATIKGVVARG